MLGEALLSASLLIAAAAALIVASLPLWLAAKLVGVERDGLGRCVLALIAWGVVSLIVLVLFSPFGVLAVLASLAASIYVFMVIFETSFWKALALLLLSVVFTVLLTLILGAIMWGTAWSLRLVETATRVHGPYWKNLAA